MAKWINMISGPFWGQVPSMEKKLRSHQGQFGEKWNVYGNGWTSALDPAGFRWVSLFTFLLQISFYFGTKSTSLNIFFSSSFQLWQTPHAHGERFKSQSHPRCFVHMEVVGNDQRADWLPAPTHSHTPIPLLLHVSLLRSLLLVYYKYIFIFHLTFILCINLFIFLFIILDVRITLRISSAAFRIVIYLA